MLKRLNYLIWCLFWLFNILKSPMEFISTISNSSYLVISERWHQKCEITSWTRRNWCQCSRYLITLIRVYFYQLIFYNHYWNLFELFRTSLIWASFEGNTEIVQLLLSHEGIYVNAQDVYLFSSSFTSIIWYFKIIIGIYLNYLRQH